MFGKLLTLLKALIFRGGQQCVIEEPAPIANLAFAPEPAPEPSQTAPAQSAYYANCAAARAAGAAPLYSGTPGYRSQLDRDGDGVACE